MTTLEPFPASTEFDELAQLEFSIAQRADELTRGDGGRNPGRNFWEEAEREIWSARLRSVTLASAV